MTGQAAAAPLTAILTQFLHPRVGFFGMFVVIAGFSLCCTFLTTRFPAHPSPTTVLRKIDRPPTSHF